MKSIRERKAILDAEIVKRQKEKWVIVNRTKNSCQFTRDKGPSGCLGIILCVFALLPGILYFTLAQNTKTLFIYVDEEGNIEETPKKNI